MPKIAINGLGRIGRAALKILREVEGVQVAAVNDLIEVDNLAYLLAHDSVYGRYDKPVTVTDDGMLSIDGHAVRVYAERDPARLPWRDLGIDLVLECTGVFRREEELRWHLEAGARFVILSAPARTETVATVVHRVNQAPTDRQVISCASCTTNCITPVVEVLDRRIGVERAIMSTVHAYTAGQQLVDGASKDVRRGRAAGVNMVPATTGAAQATTRALPALAGRFDGVAIRVPVPVGSIADITMVTVRPTSTEEVNGLFREEAATDRYRGVLGIAEEPLVSTDIIGDPRASVIDTGLTMVVDGTLVKVMSWYDNEWGFTHQMVREALSVLGVSHED
ncbi:type I glyceraldehyde-3-phosphate dehydrogenase [Streptomyces sp. UG1]|uniref:type I glyceraldehyde-3-phosphate dehydrogenase n=1 Tax=Streptomyces sp. UG1 TaxID=3417652 RepID=UPI003CECC86B